VVYSNICLIAVVIVSLDILFLNSYHNLAWILCNKLTGTYRPTFVFLKKEWW